MKILVLGNSKSGKTTAAEMIAKMIGSPPPRNCSDFIIEDFAMEKAGGIKTKALPLAKKIASNKDQYRQDLFKYGLKRQAVDPAYPVSEAAKHTNVVTGVRTKENLDASKKLFSLVLWIDRDEAKANSTDQLGPDDVDIVIDNNGTLEDLKIKLISVVSQK